MLKATRQLASISTLHHVRVSKLGGPNLLKGKEQEKGERHSSAFHLHRGQTREDASFTSMRHMHIAHTNSYTQEYVKQQSLGSEAYEQSVSPSLVPQNSPAQVCACHQRESSNQG